MAAEFKPMTPEEEKVQEDRLIRSRVQMLMAFPFFGILALNLRMECTYNVATAATDGAKFFYNPYFIKSLKNRELNWVVVHEVLHPALKHLWRKGDRMHEKWNYACDYAIHCIMMQFIDAAKSVRDKLKMPKGCLYDPKYDNLGAEEIYDLLPNDPSQNAKYGNGAPQQGGTLDDHSVWDSKEAGGAQENGQQKAQEWEGRKINSIEQAFPLIALIAGSIGLGCATEFKAWTQVFHKLPDIKGILDGTITDVPKEPDVLYALSAAIVSAIGRTQGAAQKKALSNVLTYSMNMPVEFSTLTVKLMIMGEDLRQKILTSQEWITWSRKHKNFIM